MAQKNWEQSEKRWMQQEEKWDEREKKVALREAKAAERSSRMSQNQGFSHENNNNQQSFQTSGMTNTAYGRSNAFQNNTFASANVSVNVNHAEIVTSGNINITNVRELPRKRKKAKKPLTESQAIPGLQVLRKLSEELGYNWKTVGRELGLKDGVLENLESDNINNAAERNYKMFDKWKNQKGPEATMAQLAICLNDAGSGDLADDLHDE